MGNPYWCDYTWLYYMESQYCCNSAWLSYLRNQFRYDSFWLYYMESLYFGYLFPLLKTNHDRQYSEIQIHVAKHSFAIFTSHVIMPFSLQIKPVNHFFHKWTILTNKRPNKYRFPVRYNLNTKNLIYRHFLNNYVLHL